jgi:hypothetical protein
MLHYNTTHNQPNHVTMHPLPLSLVAMAVDMAKTTVTTVLVTVTTVVMAAATAVSTMVALTKVT